MKDCHFLMQSLLYPCSRLLGPSSLFVQGLFTFRNTRLALNQMYHPFTVFSPIYMQPSDRSFQKVFDALRTLMFLLGMAFVFIGISLLAPDDSKGTLSIASCYCRILPHIIVV